VASGLAVLPPRLGHKIRPFIRASRAAIDQHVARHRIPYADDPSNEDPKYFRSRVRHEVMPLLRELSPGIVQHLCGIADDLLPQGRAEPLPRATRTALRVLESGKNSRARVALPGGRVARFDREQGKVVIEAAPARPARAKTRFREEA
jgi:tRNA(Ile)-lysidine synthase